jgi:ubiquinone/menaquinone biosynthesis C-methylase UbiE
MPSTLAGTYTYAPASVDGIGKFYCGREIAAVMGHEAAGWLDRPEREQEERTSLLLKGLALRPGMVVADIGAGSGYFSLPMAKAVQPGGKVIAVEIQPEMLAIIAQKAERQKIRNIVGRLGTVTDPKLSPGTVDLILLVDVYHEFDHPYEMTRKMVSALKKGGRLVLVEYREEDDSVPIKPLHKMSEAQVVKEMAPFGLRLLKNETYLPWQHLFIFQK